MLFFQRKTMPRPKKVEHKLTHKFEWAAPFTITEQDATDMMLIKGVAMQSGKLKSGEIMTEENVYSGGGGMRAAAIMEKAKINIDHIDGDLPEEYRKKFGKEIGSDGIIGDILDAQTVSEDGKVKVEFIGKINNKTVYDMIKNGKVKGNSVEDAVRGLKCDKECEYEGSAYFNNALIVLEVPNSDGTWVDIVTKEDLGTILSEETTQKHSHKRITKLLTKYMEGVDNDSESKVLEQYMEDGVWNDGLDSVKKFLKEEKEIEDDEFAQFIFEHPTEFSQYQLEWNKGTDLLAWWNRFKKELQMEQDILQIKKNLGVLANMPTIKTHINETAAELNEARTKQAVKYGQEDAGYMQSAEENCMSCRWFSAHDFENPEGTGDCNIVAEDVLGVGGCKHYVRNPTTPEEEPEEEEEGIENEEEQEEEEQQEKPKEQTEPVPQFTKPAPVPQKTKEELEIEKLDEIINADPVKGSMQAKAQNSHKRLARIRKHNLQAKIKRK